MKARILLLVAVLALLLLGGMLPAQSGATTVPTVYLVVQGTAAGGGYSLSGDTWQARGSAAALGYRLQHAWPLQVPACCCTYLPLSSRTGH